jgi:cytochrome c peroxidase
MAAPTNPKLRHFTTRRGFVILVGLLVLTLYFVWAGYANRPKHTLLPPPEYRTAIAFSDIASLKAKYVRPGEIPFPEENPYSVAKERLGKVLFFDPILSAKNNMSCANCHNPGLGWEDGLPKAIGFNMDVLSRKTPTILNIAWAELLMWDGRFESLEEQAIGPIRAAGEMRQNVDDLIAEVSAISGYRTLFSAAFPGEEISIELIGKAIATYERTIVSSVAPFDRWVSGNDDAISSLAKDGFKIFNGKANCAACHTSWAFTDSGFHDIGLASKDIGRASELPKIKSMKHAFKTPTLRNIVERAPYMHDGSITTLDAVVDHYGNGFAKRESLSPEMKGFSLSVWEKKALVAFLHTLSSVDEAVALPLLPR